MIFPPWRLLSLWGPVVLWCGVIFFFSSIPDLSTGLGAWDLVLRKGAHAFEFGLLAWLVWRALEGRGGLPPARLFSLTLGFCVLYAAGDEWHQGFVPGRFPSGLDVALDSLGAGLVCLWKKRKSSAGGETV